MPRNHRHSDNAPSTPPASILPALDIRPDGIYRPAQIQAALGLGARALRAEWRAGRLRVVRRCNKNYLIGRDVLDWLDSGELPSPRRRTECNGTK
jgi:hypothetical protein